MRRRRPEGRIILSLLAVLCLSSCQSGYSPTGPGATQGLGSGQNGTSSGPAPAFSGPWADMFANAYQKSATDKQRAILRDGVISDQEYAELRNDFVTCVANFGGKVTLELGGGFTVELGTLTQDQVSETVVPTCEGKTVGWVAALYEQIAVNPNRQDESTLVVACLREAGIVDNAYSPAQYNNDRSANAGLNWNDPRVVACAKDPLGKLSKH